MGEDCIGFRVVTAVGGKRVGRVVAAQDRYYIVRPSFQRRKYPLRKRDAQVDLEKRRLLMKIPRATLFNAPPVRRHNDLDPATDGHYDG